MIQIQTLEGYRPGSLLGIRKYSSYIVSVNQW